MHAWLREAWRGSGEADRNAAASVFALVGAIVVGAVGFRLWWDWDFQFTNPHAIRGWSWFHEYPKQQEVVAYAIALVSVASGVFASRPAWVIAAAAWSRATGLPPSRSLRDTAATAPLLLLLVPAILGGGWAVLAPLWLPLALCAVLVLVTGSVDPAPPDRAPSRATIPVRLLIVPLLVYAANYEEARIWRIPLDLFEEGASLAPLQTVLQGGEVYRDTYLQHGLFQNLGKPLLASYFEVSLISLRRINAWFAPLGAVAVYFLGVAVLRSWWTAIPLVLLYMGPLTVVSDRQSFGLLSVALLAAAIRAGTPTSCAASARRPRRHSALLFSSGICATLAFFYSTEVGLYALAVCGGFLALRALCDRAGGETSRLQPLLIWSAGAVVAVVPFIGYFLWRGLFWDFLHNTYVQCVYQGDVWGVAFPSLIDATAEWTGIAAFIDSPQLRAYFPVVVTLACVGAVSFRATRPGFWRRDSNQVLLLVTLAAIVWFRSALGRSDKSHITYGSPFLWLILFWYFEGVLWAALHALRAGYPARALPVLGAALAIFVIGAWVVDTAYEMATVSTRRIARAVAGVNRWPPIPPAVDRFGPQRWPGVAAARAARQEAVRKIRELTEPGDYFYDFTNQGALYFLADRRSPTRYQQVIYAATPALQREVIADLERVKPKVVLLESKGHFAKRLARLDGVATALRQNEIDAYLQANYREVLYTPHNAFRLRTAER